MLFRLLRIADDNLENAAVILRGADAIELHMVPVAFPQLRKIIAHGTIIVNLAGRVHDGEHGVGVLKGAVLEDRKAGDVVVRHRVDYVVAVVHAFLVVSLSR